MMRRRDPWEKITTSINCTAQVLVGSEIPLSHHKFKKTVTLRFQSKVDGVESFL